MKIGVIGMPGRNQYDGQSLKTRFFILGFPLFPTGCIYQISDNLGMNIPLSAKDILHGFAKIHFGLFGIGALIWMGNLRSSEMLFKVFLGFSGLALIAVCIYSWVAHHTVPDEDVTKRKIFGKAFLYNMTPEDLPVTLQKSLYGELLRTYLGKFQKVDWQKDLQEEKVTKANFYLLYTLAYYQKTLEPSPSNELLFVKIEDYLMKRKKIKDSVSSPIPTTAAAESKIKYNQASELSPVKPVIPEPYTQKIETVEDAVRMLKEITQSKKTEDTGSGNTNPQSQSSTNRTQNTNNKSAVENVETMNSKDMNKLREAQDSMQSQLGLIIGSMIFGCIVVAALSGGSAVLIYALLIVAVILGIILAVTFMPDYTKVSDDLKMRKKIKVTVRVKDISQEAGTTYLNLRPNNYRINTIKASAEYYDTGLMNKELDIYVSKSSHTLLDIVAIRY